LPADSTPRAARITVRRLTEADAEIWRDLRLEMLRGEPTSYATRLEDCVNRPVEEWRRALRILHYVATFVGDRAVGAMGLWPCSGTAERHRGSLIAVWLAPEWRGQGWADAMLSTIVDIACKHGIVQLELGVEAENARAIRFYGRQGFVAIGRHPRYLRHDGIYHDELLMVRRLDA
jgi:ribosomal protein S18 acetylase RimI-like enzyme